MSTTVLKICIAIALLQLCKATEIEWTSRDEWGARDSERTSAPLPHPVTKIVIAHTASPACTGHYDCINKIKNIQNYHMTDRKFTDISYNFLIGSSVQVYEGRGWNIQGQHTTGHNEDTLAIAFVGNYQNAAPGSLPLRTLHLLLEEGVRDGHISPNYKLYGHRQLMDTVSPGDALYNEIKSWSHWSSSV